jgi:hypothetical protein
MLSGEFLNQPLCFHCGVHYANPSCPGSRSRARHATIRPGRDLELLAHAAQ